MYFVRTNLDVDVIVTELQVPSSSEEAAKRKRTIADANALFGFTIERERERERERAVSLVKLAPVFLFCFLIIPTCSRGALGLTLLTFIYYVVQRSSIHNIQ